MEGDIQNYSPTVMFRGKPCIWLYFDLTQLNYLLILQNFTKVQVVDILRDLTSFS